MEFDKVLQSRKSVRRFSPKKPDWRDIIEAIDAARFAPMAGNEFTPRFILVNDQKKIQKIADASQQLFISEASFLVVVCSSPSKAKIGFGERGDIYVRQQAGAAIENFLLKLEDLGLATCWVGHFVDEQIKEILEIPEDIIVEAIFPVGYESIIKGAKERRRHKPNLDFYLYFNKWKEKRMVPLEKLEI